MADTQTVHFRWVMPEVGSAATTWGGSLNGDLADIDTQVFAAQQAGLPIGSIAMFAGVGPPANWLICDGRPLSTTTYASLFAVIGNIYTLPPGGGGNFNIPNMQGVFPIGAGRGVAGTNYALAATGGEEKHALLTTELAAHSHTITDKSHTHVVSNIMAPASGGHQATTGSGSNITDVTTQAAFTGITGTNAAGSGTPHQNLPPYLVFNFIIRAS
jgi:microcystin-dependent protein